MNFNTLQETAFLLKCVSETDINKDKFLQRLSDLYDTGMISDYAFYYVSDILGVHDESIR